MQDTNRSPPTSSGKHCPYFGFSSSFIIGSLLAQSDLWCISVRGRVKMTREALTRNPPNPSTSGNLPLGAATNANFCIMEQTLHLVAAAAQQQSERAGSMPTQMARPGRAATKVCGGRVKLCSRLLPPRFSHPSATPGQQSQDTHSKHSLLH